MALSSLVLAALAVGAQGTAAQEPVVPVTENLVVEGVPTIPRSLAERVGRYTEFRAAALADWHPTRRELLISTRFGNVAQVHRVATPLGMRKQLTFFPEAVSGAQYNPRDPGTFVFSKDVGGNENFQLYRYDVNTGESTLLTDGKSRNEDPVWSPDGRFVLYASSRRNGRDSDFYVVDPRNPASDRRIRENAGGGWYPLDVSEDGRSAVVLQYVSANESYLHLLDLTNGQMREIAGKDGGQPVAYGGALFPSGRGNQGRVFVVSDRGSEFQQLAQIDVNTKQYVPMATFKWDVEAFDVSDDNRIAAVTNEAGASVLHVIDGPNGKPRRIANVPTGVISGVKWSHDNREIGFGLSSAQSSSDVYSVDARSGRLTRWTESETGGLNTANFVTPELVRWQSDGQEITGFLYRPKRTGKVPVIINIHGGPESQYRPGFLGRSNYYVNELGVAILFPNVRGSSGYGKSYLAADNGFERERSYRDIGSLLDWIRTQPGLDADRVMVTGGSYGGHMTFVASYLFADRMAAALPVVGMSSLVSFLENTAEYRRDLRRVEYGDERDPKMREFLLRIAPLNNAAKITKPIFVVQGANDPRVPYSEATQFVERIKGVNPNVWFLAAKDEGHGFAKKNNADFQFYATVMFIQRYLLRQ